MFLNISTTQIFVNESFRGSGPTIAKPFSPKASYAATGTGTVI
jgi:hypothetical protein